MKLKKIFCSVLTSMLLISSLAVTASAINYSKVEKKRGVNYTINVTGNVCNFTAYGDAQYAKTTLLSNYSQYTSFSVRRYNYNTKTDDLKKIHNGVGRGGEAITVMVPRSSSSMVYDYKHDAAGFAGEGSHTPVIDRFNYKAQQYYE